MLDSGSDRVCWLTEAVTVLERTSTPYSSDNLPPFRPVSLMRELERQPQPTSAHAPIAPERVAIVGSGRLGNGLGNALRRAGVEVIGPLTRGAAPVGVDAVLVCVPDGEIGSAVSLIPDGPLVGHCSGATGLDVFAGREGFSLHPLMTVTSDAGETDFAGAGAAVAGSSPAALELARTLVTTLGMAPIEVAPADRAAYHAAASIASNFLITLEAAAEQLAATAGVEREHLVPLVRAAVDNWARLGPEGALTGPVARGDELTVAAQRHAVSERTPELVALFDALVDATRSLAHRGAMV
jgi:predicted short-subunit dehydrogenase-like oxidoreductase (DUF2520 family)